MEELTMDITAMPFKRDKSLTGERKLMAMVLSQAFYDLLNVDTRSRKAEIKKEMPQMVAMNQQARDVSLDWFMSQETEPGSFLWICWVLDYSPQKIRLFIVRDLPELSWDERKQIANKLSNIRM